jgi:glutamate synthase (ferredoxin)
MIVKKDRLRPGKMLLADTKQGRIIEDDELKTAYASRQPYGEWLDANLVRLHDLHIPNKGIETYSEEELKKLQKAFGYSYEDIRTSILPMAEKGGEPIASMGSDIALPPLDDKQPPLFNYFRQLFAQVTNPPIDAIREEVVTDTGVYIGKDGNILEECEENCRVLQIKNPILTETDMLKIKNVNVRFNGDTQGFDLFIKSLLSDYLHSGDADKCPQTDVVDKAEISETKQNDDTGGITLGEEISSSASTVCFEIND